MQTSVTIMMNLEGKFFTSYLDNNGQQQYIPTNFEVLDNVAPDQTWVMMTKTITQYKYNKCGIMNSKIEDMLKFVKEELEFTPDISVLCYKPEITVDFFKE